MIWNTCLSMSLAMGASCSIIMLGYGSYCVKNIAPLHNKKKSARRNLAHGAKIDCQCFSRPCTATNGLANGSYTERIVKVRKQRPPKEVSPPPIP